MRIDIVSIFPEYFDALTVSLMGRAREQGLVEITVHDLRDATSDRHRSVDDTPYGGGAGMVMSPEPWGVMLDQIVTAQSTLIFPTPAGQLFDQGRAQALTGTSHLVFACGRYEGIDQRVVEYYRSVCDVYELSIGDYVLNGGEVAAIAMIEACVRLLPGVVGNPDSLVEESHAHGLVEYPSFTKPAQWRGLNVPPVLLSGHHAEVASWRHSQSAERTKRNRPDLWEHYATEHPPQ